MPNAVRSLSFILAATLSLAPAAASATYRDLCASVPAACEYTGPDAPALGADVCWSTSTGVRLKGTGACPSGAWPYYLAYGEIVDPVTGAIAAYVPLDWACSHPGICEEGDPPTSSDPQEQTLCCEFGFCVPVTEVPCDSQNSILVFCFDGVTNTDGSVTCFEGDYPD